MDPRGGFQYANNDVSNDFEVKDELDGQWVVDASLTNVFEFVQGVLGVYGMAAYESDTWGAQLGLRTENTQINTRLVNTNQKTIKTLPICFLP